MESFYYNSRPWELYLESINAVKIESGVTSIGEHAFYNCASLTAITLPDSVTSIGRNAFQNCSNLAIITLPDGLTSISTGAFQRCTSLTTIAIPDGVTRIRADTFDGCTDLTTVTLPDGVTSIDSRAFYGCTNLSSDVIPDSITSIGDYAFYNCTSLPPIVLPDGLEYLGILSFRGCRMTEIIIPDGVTSIEEGVFLGCDRLASITIPAGVTSIGPRAFVGCTSLTSITLPDALTSIASRVFDGCTGLTAITIPANVTIIKSGAFMNCSRLATYTFLGQTAPTLDSVGAGVFENSALNSIIRIPAGATGYTAENGWPVEKLRAPVSSNPALDKTMLRLTSDTPQTVTVTNFEPLNRAGLKVVFMETTLDENGNERRGTPADTSDFITADLPAAGDPVITLTRKAGQTESAVVYVRVRYDNYPAYYAECRVEVDNAVYTDVANYAKVTIATPKATAYTRAAGGAKWPAAALELVHTTPQRTGDAKTKPVAMAGATIEFAEGSTADANKYFSFTANGEDTLLVNYATTTDLKNKKTFSGFLTITPAGETEGYTTTEKLTLTVSTDTPKLKVGAIKYNTFYVGSALSVKVEDYITGGTVTGLSLPVAATALTNAKKAKANADALATWLTFAPDSTLTLKKTDAKMAVKTLSLEAELEGWTGKVPVSIKASSVTTKPALKLKAASGKLYATVADTDPLGFQIVPKTSKVHYDELGIDDLTIADDEGIFTLDFDENTGIGSLTAKADLPDTTKKYTVKLRAHIAGTPADVGMDLKYTVNVVKAGTVVKLKASQTTVNLNTGLTDGDKATVYITPSILGYKLKTSEITPVALTSKGGELTDVPFAYSPVNANGSLNISVAGGTAAGTYKLRLTYSNNQYVDIKVALAEKPVTASAKVTGSVNLTTGASATLSVKYNNYRGIASSTDVTFYSDKNGTNKVTDVLMAAPITGAPNTYAIVPMGNMAKGTYYVGVSAETTGGTIRTKPVKVSVTAPKPKVTQSIKKATLYKADHGSEAVIKLSTPVGTKPITKVEILPAKNKTADDTGYKLPPIGGGYYAIRFVGAPTDKVPAKTTKLTLNVYLEGNTAPATTVSVSITAK